MNAQAPQPGPPAALPLHATWWQVLKPNPVVLSNNQPAYEVVATVETLAHATAVVAAIPGGVIVMNTAVFVNPKASAILRPPPPGARPGQ